jgi:uncharacterized protein YecE (DUF72 family)
MIYIGTAGWSYKHWRGTFYPRDVGREIGFYSQYADFNEINTTFYRLPSETTIRIWYHYTPDDFVFSAKMIRDVTHTNRAFTPDIIKGYFDRMKGLEDKLRVILLQFPPRFRKTPKTMNHLTQIIEESRNQFNENLVLELRNNSWLDAEVKDLLKEHSIALAETLFLSIPDEFHSEGFPIYYIRLLGDRELIPDEKLGKVFLDKSEELTRYVQRLSMLNNIYQTIFIVINNRFSGYAINDAISLNKQLTKEQITVKGFENHDKYIQRQRTLLEFI